ncbi:DNA polymerase [Methanoplanus sp. FWC-SCC4]|uniref:DNA polymerase n=1 Tax=Methanochimaera problematica TaxID=2609417 RepID=A0AA97FB72_9EURY|nr:DNA-directed DNA polymerase [Methanoplanus sp. FWC-SCC4]WOF15687.1 DNA polymerase [Methanoplanus sp. FWC-SCC4]
MEKTVPVKIAINQVEYSNTVDGTVVHIFGREESGKAHQITVTGFKPYFYALKEQAESMAAQEGAEVDTENVSHSIRGEELLRIYTPNPGKVREMRESYRHFEADIPFATRFMIDNNLTGGVEAPSEMPDFHDIKPVEVNAPARICLMDIECEDKNGFPEASTEKINCVTAWDSFDDEYITFFWPKDGNTDISLNPSYSNHNIRIYQGEYAMLSAIVEYISEKDPDVLSGWNFVDFDIPYILKRMEILGINEDSLARIPGQGARNPARGRSLFDLLTAYKKMQGSRKESYRLDAIGEEELGEGKIRYTGTISDLWENDPQKLIDYNLKDVELCVGINKKNNIIEFYREISRYVGCPLDRTLNSSNVIDIFVLRKAFSKYVLPSKGYADAEEFEGATVFSPSLGVKENVIVLDLKSLYPMCMMTINASPETKDKNGELRAPNGIRFKKEPDGLTRSIISELLKERDEKKAERNRYEYGSYEYTLFDLQQNVLKVIMNTYYGVSGYARFRLYDREIGSAVTSVGRSIIEHTRNVIEGMGYTVLYGDTDSCMIQLPVMDKENTIHIARKIESTLNESYSNFAKESLGADEHYFSIKFEKIYERFFQAGKKKRYAGYLVWKEGQDIEKIDIVGFEMKRSDSPHITKEVQHRVMELILKGAERSELKKYLSEIIKKYRKGEYSLDDIGIPGGIGKNLQSYANKDAHIRGAIYSNEYLGTDFKRGSKPKRVYIKCVTSKYPQTDVIDFEYADQVPLEFVIDWETMMDKSIKQPISRIIEAIGMTWADVDPSRTTLFDFGM